MNYQTLNQLTKVLSDYCQDDTCRVTMVEALESAKHGESKGWVETLDKLIVLVEHGHRLADPAALPFNVIGEGNGKLPFLTFSALPFITCPGAGICEAFCYSPKAWRYPAAFARQFQNTLLVMTKQGKRLIVKALDRMLARPKYAKRERVDFRLYVDGDIDSVETLDFWMNTLRDRPNLAGYGYSKSFHEFIGYGIALEMAGKEWPSNYVLNVSSGHKHSQALEDAVKTLPITRGSFKAVDLPALKGKGNTRQTRATLRQAYQGKAFTCPGKCGDCTPNGHACGSMRFAGHDIIIAVH